jgi:hypothetical protein
VTISVVLASSRPAGLLTQAVSRLLPQCRRAQAELIVARAGDSRAAPEAFEGCREVHCRAGASLPEIRGAGLAAATGDWVLLTEDGCLAHPDWVQRLTARFAPDCDVVGGVMGTGRPARSIDAAAGFVEYGFYGLLQRPSAAPALACANVAYHRRVLADVAAWSSAGQWEAEIHARLAAQGARFRLVTDALVEPNVPHRLGEFCQNRYQHGRDYARVRSGRLAMAVRLGLACGTPMLPAVLTWRVWHRAGRAAPGEFFRALPFTLVFFGAWASGEAAGYLRRNAAA